MSRIRSTLAGICPVIFESFLILIISCGIAAGQAITALYDTTWIPLQHSMSSIGDSLAYGPVKITLIESAAGILADGPGDSVKVEMPPGFLFTPDSVVCVSTSSTRTTGVHLDTTGCGVGAGGLLPGSAGGKLLINPVCNSGLYIAFMVQASSTERDTLTITGISVRSIDTTGVMFDSTTGGNMVLSQSGIPSNTTTLSRLVALPGPAAQIGFGPAGRMPSAGQTAGNVINTEPGGTAAADTGKGVVICFLDRMNNLTSFGTSIPNVRALLSLTDIPGNGTLGGTARTHWYDGHHVSFSFDSLCYLKSEKIDLEFSFGTSTVRTSAAGLTSGITVAPGKAANISATITSKDEYAVDETKKYNLVVTDRFFNPVNPTWIQARELTPHGGIFTGTGIHGDSICTGTGSSLGETAFTFDPGNYFVGRDTLAFIARSSSPPAVHYRDVLITPGELGGILADYSGSVNGPAISEKIAAGERVYVRAFLRDSYGNPIDADLKSGVNFSIGSVLSRGMSLDQSGILVTDPVREAQYLNSANRAEGIAIPYRVSTNVRENPDTVIAGCDNYSVPVLIRVRSNRPSAVAMMQTAGNDSSVIVSQYTESIAFSDSVRDIYGNPADDPGSSVTVEPGHSSYGIVFSTGGLVGLADGAGIVTADTLYPSAGVVRVDLHSGTRTGVDTLRSWPELCPAASVSSPVWVTPSAFSRIDAVPGRSGAMTAGETMDFLVEKLDRFGNHIDWGLTGNNRRRNSAAVTKPSISQIAADSAGLHVDTVATGKNRGGVVDGNYFISGLPGVASVGGTLKAGFPYTASITGADTQAICVRLTNGGTAAYDTVVAISVPAGMTARLLVELDTSNAMGRLAGDSVSIRVTAIDSCGRRVYTYCRGEHAIALLGTSFEPIAGSDTTHHFTYLGGGGKHVRSTGRLISDSVFSGGQAVFYLHKFAVDGVPNTVSVSGNGRIDTSETAVLFHPLPVDSSFGYWSVVVPDTVDLPGTFEFTVVPRDKYYNVNSSEDVIVNIASSKGAGIDFGMNPKAVRGPTTFYATSSLPFTEFTVCVYNRDGSKIYGAGTVKVLQAIRREPGVPREFGLSQNYPNPFNPSTEITISVPSPALVSLRVYDILGRSVRTLVDGKLQAGRYTLAWDGLTDSGARASAGVYFYRVTAGKLAQVKKMVMLK